MYLSLLFFYPLSSSFAAFSYYFFLSIFDVSLPLCYRGFPPLGLCLRVMEVRIVMRFFSLILLGQAFCEKFHFLHRYHLISFVPFFFLFFSLLQAAKLNYVRFENFALCLFYFTLVSSLLRLIAGLYNTCFSRAPQRLSILNSL
jgi:hypothetical protein